MSSWGYHSILNIAGCNPRSIRCSKHIALFSKELVKRIDMEAYGKPKIIMFGTGNKKGYTLVQLIHTSNITAHFCEEDNAIFLDVFSCKPYNKIEIEKVVDEYFEPKVIYTNYFERSIPELK